MKAEQNIKRMELWLKENRFTVVCVLVFSALTHGYRFANLMFSHDSLVIDQTLDAVHKVALGRYLQPVYWLFRGGLTAPLLIGVLSTVFLAIAVCVIFSLFEIKEKAAILLLSGILSTNTTLTYTYAAYIHEGDAFMLSLLFAAAAVWVFQKQKGGLWKGAILLCISMGLYQSYIQAAILLLMLILFFELLDGIPAAQVFGKGLRSVGMLAMGSALYYALFRLALLATGIAQEESYNGMGSLGTYAGEPILYHLVETYRKVFHVFHSPDVYRFLNTPDVVSRYFLWAVAAGINALLIGGSAVVFLMHCKNKRLPAANMGLAVLLAVLMPFGSGVTNFLSKGLFHSLMMYAVYLFYLLAFVLLTRYTGKPWVRLAACVGIAVLIWNNVVLANQIYLKKALQEQTTLSFMTRLADRLEQMEGYVPGETPVVFVGDYRTQTNLQPLQGFEALEAVGSYPALTVTNPDSIEQYFRFILNTPIEIADFEYKTHPEMSCFPAAGSCIAENGTVVVRLS